jgi:hypothetical protein
MYTRQCCTLCDNWLSTSDDAVFQWLGDLSVSQLKMRMMLRAGVAEKICARSIKQQHSPGKRRTAIR